MDGKTPAGKTCKTCKRVKPFEQFEWHGMSKDGRSNHCRVCRRKQAYPDFAKPVLQAMRSVELTEAQGYNRFGRIWCDAKAKLLTLGYIELAGQRYRLTEKGRDDAPRRNPASAHCRPAVFPGPAVHGPSLAKPDHHRNKRHACLPTP